MFNKLTCLLVFQWKKGKENLTRMDVLESAYGNNPILVNFIKNIYFLVIHWHLLKMKYKIKLKPLLTANIHLLFMIHKV